MYFNPAARGFPQIEFTKKKNHRILKEESHHEWKPVEVIDNRIRPTKTSNMSLTDTKYKIRTFHYVLKNIRLESVNNKHETIFF